MPSQKSNCYRCGKTVSKSYAKRHCLSHSYTGEDSEIYRLVKIESVDIPDYWLYIAIRSNAVLGNLDTFLRAIWLECCGHMSAFHQSGYDELAFEEEISDFSENTVLQYEYDFGDTTRLKITFLETISLKATQDKNPVILLLRNEPFAFECQCGKPATYVCQECAWEETYPFYCDTCNKKHERKQDHCSLPVVNSPRMCVCGYTGELDTYTFNPDDYT